MPKSVNLSGIARLVFCLFLAFAVSACSTSQTLDLSSYANDSNYASIIVDSKTGKVLHSANADKRLYPASLTKMMTIYLLFDAMKQRKITAQTQIPVSAYAAGRPASKLYLKTGSSVSVDTAIRSLVVKSANDVATAVAEFLGGSEQQFAQMMTRKARQIGMRSTVFKNASGLPDSEMRSTARDMALLSMALQRNHARYYGYFGLTSFTYKGKQITGHNKVLANYAGANGLKTGYTRASGFNLATSASRRGKSVVAIVMGGDSSRARDAHMVELLDSVLK